MVCEISNVETRKIITRKCEKKYCLTKQLLLQFFGSRQNVCTLDVGEDPALPPL